LEAARPDLGGRLELGDLAREEVGAKPGDGLGHPPTRSIMMAPFHWWPIA
jgi:hypothetical protein